MSTYDQIVSLPLCAGLTGLGLVLSYLVMRRRGLGAGLRGAAWSLLPLAAYLTGSVKMFWKMGVAIGGLRQGLRVLDRGLVRHRGGRAGRGAVRGVRSGCGAGAKRGQDQQAVGTKAGAAATTAAGREIAPRTAPVATTPSAQTPVKARKGKNAADDDDDLGDVEDILRRHGIT